MKGPEIRELREAIVNAFTRDDLAMLLRFELDVQLDLITSGSGPFELVAFDIIKWAEMNGVLEALVRALARARPNNIRLHEVAAGLNLLEPSVGTAVPRSKEEAFNSPVTFMDRESWFARRAAFELTVCRLYANGSGHGPVAAGLLVGPDLILTCGVESDITSNANSVRLNIGVDDQGRPTETINVPFADQAHVSVIRAGNMNCRIMRLSHRAGGDHVDGPTQQTRGWLYLDPKRTTSSGDGTYLLRHSDEGSLQFAYRDDSIASVGTTQVQHRHDPLALVGSPIVTKDWAVVAIHNGRDEKGQSLGIQIRGILDELGKRGESGLFKTSFQVEPGSVDESVPVQKTSQ